jgi:flagellar basal-body rod protein FlgF
MDNALYYLALNRQVGLKAEMDTIANNIANLSTSGFRKEQLIFSEFVRSVGEGESVSLADLGARFASELAGTLQMTGAELDLAIDGEGFFMIDGAEGPLLTRAGGFQRSSEGFLVTPNGESVLDEGQAPIFLPPDASAISVASDGTVSADGLEIARIGVVTAPAESLSRVGNTAFVSSEPVVAVPDPRVTQGALEGSNVVAVDEIARMIAVSRAYEQIQNLITDEDQRIRDSIRTLGENT